MGGLPSGPCDGFSQWPGQPLTQARQRGAGGRLRGAENEPGRVNSILLLREGDRPGLRGKEAVSITPPGPPCQPDGPASQHYCSPAREMSHLQEQGGDIPDGGTSPLVTGTMASGSLWLLPSTWPQTWPQGRHLSPGEHIWSCPARRPGRRCRETACLAEAATQTQPRPVLKSKRRLWYLGHHFQGSFKWGHARPVNHQMSTHQDRCGPTPCPWREGNALSLHMVGARGFPGQQGVQASSREV